MNLPTFDSNDIQSEEAHVADLVSDLSQGATRQAKKVAKDAADSVREATEYVRESGGDVADQIKRYLKAHPSHALIGAAVVGFFVARLMSRN